jgi:mediator of RNA polymerase II transcription subunit 12
VSLTNTKREAWLSDLANPACALRRFNRTIPYGINGKGLLEQCLAKEIPTTRAIWLVKCIGANELRTLKRKGVGGALGLSAESKWVREWTMHVEQFIDATVLARSDESWKEKVQYVVRLTYHLYIEQLLDHDHFLDWVMSSFECSSSDRLPLWLVHLQLYWRFLVYTRKRGRRLAEAVCNSLKQIESDRENSDLFSPVSQRLRQLLGTLASSHTACLIMPKIWAKFEPVVRNIGSRVDLAPAVASVVERNNRLAKPLWEQSPRSTVSPKRQAFSILDHFDLDVSVPDICANLCELLPSVEGVAKLVLEWCSSSYRQGAYRVYLASRILRRYGLFGADIEGYILMFLMDPPANSNVDVRNIIKVVAELVRAKSFAVLKVLRAVIARGAMSDSEHNPQAASRLRQLVRGIPTAGLPQHVGDLQRNLLREGSQPGLSKLEPVVVLKQLIDQTVFRRSEFKWTQKEEGLLHSLSVAEKFEISSHIRLEILRIAKSSRGAGLDGDGPHLTCLMLQTARDLLEKVGDFPLLADVIGICVRQSNGEMLASAINTIHYHSRTFAAIGALRPLTAQSIERYHVFRNEMLLEKAYLSALIGLLSNTKGEPALIQQLTYDLARCDERSGLAICSPASDNTVDLVASNPLESEEEIEQILTSGTTMDEQSVGRVFQRLITHLTTPSKAQTKADWFSRLRAFDEATFDSLLSDWVSDLLQIATEDVCRTTLRVLLGAGAISFEGLVQIERNVRGQHESSADAKCKLAIVMISLLLLHTNASSTENLNVSTPGHRVTFQPLILNSGAIPLHACAR